MAHAIALLATFRLSTEYIDHIPCIYETLARTICCIVGVHPPKEHC